MNLEASNQTKWKVWFKESAYKEFKQLDGSVKRKVAAQLLKIEQNPFVGESLGNKMGVNLTGYRKIHVDKKRVRIVWKIDAARVVVTIMGIGPRDKGEIYKLIINRMSEGLVRINGEKSD